MRRKPEVVKLVVTRDVRPGGDLDVHVVLKSASKTPVNAITLRLEGAEKHMRAGDQPLAIVRWIVSQLATLMGKGELDEGTHQFRARFRLPADAIPTYNGKWLAVDYVLRLYVDIPWWPDLDRRYTAAVTPHVRTRPPQKPVAETTARGGPEPFIEVTLDDVVFAPGDPVSGALALGNLRGKKARSLELCVVAVEQVARQFTVEGPRYPVHFSPDDAREGKECRFRFSVPKTIAPSYESPATSLTYLLEIRVEWARSSALVHRIPIVIARLDRPSDTSARGPDLGQERWRRVWASAGEPLGLTVEDDALELNGRIGRSGVSIYVDPDTEETALVAELTFPSLEIGLRVRLRRLAILGMAESDGFERRYKVSGRDAAQVRGLLSAPLRRALLAFNEAYVDDERVRVKLKSPRHDEPYISHFIQLVSALASALDEARERVPPPSPMASMAGAWRAFADELEGALTVGSMSIRNGRLEAARFDVETVFEEDPEPTRTRLSLIIDPPLGEGFRPVSLLNRDAEAFLEERGASGAAQGLREVYAEVAKDAREVRVNRQSIDVALEAPLADPASLRPRMASMLILAKKLRGDKGAGPYR